MAANSRTRPGLAAVTLLMIITTAAARVLSQDAFASTVAAELPVAPELVQVPALDAAAAEPLAAEAAGPGPLMEATPLTSSDLAGEVAPEDGSAVAAEPSGGVSLAATTPVLGLTATGTVSGKTPAIIGINHGHRYPGSNWPVWMQRLGVNGVRVFLTSLWGSSLESFVGGSTKWGKSLSGAAVTNLATFQAAVAELRTPAGRNPAQAGQFSNPVRWSTFDTKWTTTVTSSPADEQEGNHNATLAALGQLPGMNPPLVVIGCGLGSVRDSAELDQSTAAYWAKSWEVYKHLYAFSRYLYVRGITRIEHYNEPDLDNDFQNADGTFKNALWVDTIALRSRAIQDLYSDMNQEAGSSPGLVPNIHVGAYAKTTYGSPNLGQPGVQAMHQTFATGTATNASWFNFQTYSYHSYGQSGKTILSNFNDLLAASAADRAAQGDVPFSMTEHNARTSGSYSTSTANLDDAAEAVKLASQSINLATAGDKMTSLYAFKFGVTLSGSNGVAKNGIHWGDNVAAPYNIADTTLGAEAYRLIAERLSGAKDIQVLNKATNTLNDTKSIAVREGNAFYVYIANQESSAVSAQLALSQWSIPAGAPVFVNRVNASAWGEVTEQLTVSSSAVTVLVGADNLVRLTIPAAPVTLSTVTAAATTHVRAGSNSNTAYGSLAATCVGSNSGTHTNTYASVMRFTVANPSSITSAVLRLTVSSLSASLTANMPMLLLAVPDNGWTPATTWTSLTGSGGPLQAHPPAGSSSTWKFDSVAKNFVNYRATGIRVAGHVTLANGLTTTKAAGVVKMVDVTSAVKASSGSVSFVLVRPFRRNTEKATGDTMAADTLNGGAFACFHSATATTAGNRPQLLVY